MNGTITQISRLTLHERVYEELKQQIILGRFEPGQILALTTLAESVGTSVQPVREAVQRLVAEQALEPAKSRKIRGPLMSEAGLEEITAIRKALSTLAVELAIERMSAEEIAGLKKRRSRTLAAISEQDIDQAIRGTIGIYDDICRGAKSASLERMLHGIWLRLGPIYSNTLATFLSQEATVAPKHKLISELIAALESRDPKRAVAATHAAVDSTAELMQVYCAQFWTKTEYHAAS